VLVIRPLTKIRNFIALLCGMAAAAAMVIVGFPEPPPGFGKVELLLILWFFSIVIWWVLVAMIGSKAKAQQPKQSGSDGGQNRQA